jgi:HD-GYP domain-containing protein (c-di-GMP phosphodiesterase class II)
MKTIVRPLIAIRRRPPVAGREGSVLAFPRAEPAGDGHAAEAAGARVAACRGTALCCAGAAAAVGLAALLGWLTGSRTLTAVRPDFIPMAPNTALCLLALSVSVGIVAATRSPRAVGIARFVASGPLLLAGIRLGEYLSDRDWGADAWFLSVPGESFGLAPIGKMAFFTAFDLLLAAAAVLLIPIAVRSRLANDVAKAMAAAVSVMGLGFALGYAYGAPLLYGTPAIPMALNTAVGLAAIGTAGLVLSLEHDVTARRAAREALHRANAELELRVARRTAELAETNAVLEREVKERRRAEAEVRQLNRGLQDANVKLTLAYDTTLEGWSRAMDLRDRETEGHTQRVTELTTRLALAMGMSDDELIHVRRGALLHDIGKMGIPDRILLKPGPLDEDEWAVMRMHPVYAHQLLARVPFLQRALDIPYCHHERWDGTGYPRGLRGDAIPLAARVFAVVDVWDALRSDRPYRRAWSEERTVEHLESLAGVHFDARALTCFLIEIVPDLSGHGLEDDAMPALRA